jgi:hypothetical protein
MLTTLWAGTYGRPWSDIPETSDDNSLNKAILSGKRPPLDPGLYRVPLHIRSMCEPVVSAINQCWDVNPKNRITFLDAHDKLWEVEKAAVVDRSKPLEISPMSLESPDKPDIV